MQFNFCKHKAIWCLYNRATVSKSYYLKYVIETYFYHENMTKSFPTSSVSSQWTVLSAWTRWQECRTPCMVHSKLAKACSALWANCTRSNWVTSWPPSETPTLTLSAASSPTTRRRYWKRAHSPHGAALQLLHKCIYDKLLMCTKRWEIYELWGVLLYCFMWGSTSKRTTMNFDPVLNTNRFVLSKTQMIGLCIVIKKKKYMHKSLLVALFVSSFRRVNWSLTWF